jgi:hypothetical protein
MRIIYTNAEGGCSIVIPAPDTGLTIEEVAAKSVPAGTPYKIVPVTEIPSDRTYRNAFVADVVNGKVHHDIVKAREIRKDHMRRARTPLMAALDVAYTRADEKGHAGAAEKAQIAAQKQALRDVTADAGIAAATTPEELKAVWPAVLGPKPYGGA